MWINVHVNVVGDHISLGWDIEDVVEHPLLMSHTLQGAPTETLDHVTTFERVHFRREDIMMPETRGRRALHHPGAFSLDVNAFGASYRLNLERNVNIFQKDATVSVMHGDGKVEEVTLDHMAYYTGVVGWCCFLNLVC